MGDLVVLLDGPNLAARAFHAARASMGDSNAAFLFINSLSRLLRDERPDRFLICWDYPGPGWRNQLYPDYKANRPGGGGGDAGYVGEVLDFCELAGLPVYCEPGYEADDVIAAAHARHRADADEVVILSSDKDLMQLLDECTAQVRFAAGNADTDRWDAARFLDCYGFTPDRWPLMTALTGDPGDNVPGVRGLGPKKALKLLQAADWVLAESLVGRPFEDLRAAELSLALVDLRRIDFQFPIDVPVFAPTDERSGARWSQLITYCEQREMHTVIKRLEAGLLWP